VEDYMMLRGNLFATVIPRRDIEMNSFERRRAHEALLTFEDINKLLRYEPETGKLYWKRSNANRVEVGDETGNFNRGYLEITINYHNYRAHRVAYLLTTGKWPKNDIDHCDHDGTNNKWSNLRDATRTQNSYNQTISIRNKSGIKGVRFNKLTQRYLTEITINGKNIHLGSFKTLEPAVRKRLLAEKHYFGEFRHNPEAEVYLTMLSCLSM
jgi:HNH endonuclease